VKVLLVNQIRDRLFSHSSLGLLYLAASLRTAGHEVDFIEGTRKELADYIEIASWDYEVIGFTVMSSMLADVLALAKYAKFLNPEILAIAGGPHATIQPGDLLQPGDIDFCVIGEGEQTIIEMLFSIDIKSVPGVAWKNGNCVDYSPRRKPIKNLSDLPFPARDLLDASYFSKHSGSIMASRGCPYNCFFCQPTLRNLFGSEMRWRSPGNVISEMLECKEKYGITHFQFLDDTFTADPEWCEEFYWYHRYLKDCTFEILTRVNAVDYQLLRMLKAAGLTRITFGVESGSQEILDYYKKGVTIHQIKQAFSICHNLGIKTHGLFMLGAPMETKETILATEQLIHEIKPDSIFVSITTPLPGTGLAADAGEITDFSLINYYSRPLMKLKYMEPHQIISARKHLLYTFYIRKLLDPGFIWGYLRNKSWKDLKAIFNDIVRS
jgi:anaerobic magnesium-protoporphyrin IX monomethyl ester cyclase